MIKINPDWKFEKVYPSIGAYTTAYNCLKNGYPIEKAIRSFSWVDELVVVDGGSDDGTLDKLNELASELDNLQVVEVPIDWDDPGKDGALKAMSRAMTTTDFVIQFDADEFCGGDPTLWKEEAKKLQNSNVDILNLFVYEPIGDMSHLRLNKEHNPSKWRLYKNKAEISHGIPAGDRLEKDGKVYSRGGSDGCFPVHIVTNELYPSKTPEYLTRYISVKNAGNKTEAANLAKEILDSKPHVVHVGHVDLKKKINLYLNEWKDWWAHLYDKDLSDPKNNLYFPGVPFEDVTTEMIEEKAREIAESTPTAEVSFG